MNIIKNNTAMWGDDSTRSERIGNVFSKLGEIGTQLAPTVVTGIQNRKYGYTPAPVAPSYAPAPVQQSKNTALLVGGGIAAIAVVALLIGGKK